MRQLYTFIAAHKLPLFFAASVLVEQLPPPDGGSGKLYRYLYSVLQFFFANWRRSYDAVRPTVADTPAPEETKP